MVDNSYCSGPGSAGGCLSCPHGTRPHPIEPLAGNFLSVSDFPNCRQELCTHYLGRKLGTSTSVEGIDGFLDIVVIGLCEISW